MFADAYLEPVVLDPADDAAAVTALFDLQRAQQTPEYSAQAFEVDLDGHVLQDVSAYLVKDTNGAVSWDCTANTPGGFKVTLDAAVELTWGSSILAVYQLIRSTEYNAANSLDPGTWLRFALCHFVVTSPGFDDLDASDVRQVSGFDKNYLLQSAPQDTFSFEGGSLYLDAVQALFLAAGLIDAALTEVCDFPGDWAGKTLATPANYPIDGSVSYLDIVNDRLKASGCRPLYTQPNGRWLVEALPIPASQALRWAWLASSGEGATDAGLDAPVILGRQTRYSGDVWNVPNRWVFIQQGLTFTPTMTDGSDGMYVVDNTLTPPGDQTTVGRVLCQTQYLQASGQADLTAQGDAFVAAALSDAEKIEVSSAPWPAARHYDVFSIYHRSLPGAATRRVQAQSWTLPLWGDAMSWKTNVVVPV